MGIPNGVSHYVGLINRTPGRKIYESLIKEIEVFSLFWLPWKSIPTNILPSFMEESFGLVLVWKCRPNLAQIRGFFLSCYLTYSRFHPASEIELPRPEKRLPKAPLSLGEVEAALSVPDIADPLGLRDRAILETIYSTGMRRCELVAIELADLNIERRTIHIRKGKGKKERMVPAGERALEWIERYIEEGRPRLLVDPNEKTLFLTAYGEPFNPDFLSHHVRKIVKKSDTGRDGSCHLFRHSCATHMLENGADIRVIQQLLGHSKLESTQIYTEVSIRHLQEVHARTHPGATEKTLANPRRLVE